MLILLESVGSLGGFRICFYRYMHFGDKIWQQLDILHGLVVSSFVCYMFFLFGWFFLPRSIPPGLQGRISRGWKWDSVRRVGRDNEGYIPSVAGDKMIVGGVRVGSISWGAWSFRGLSLLITVLRFFLLSPDGIAFCPPSRWFEKYHQGKLDRSCLKIAGLKLHVFPLKNPDLFFACFEAHRHMCLYISSQGCHQALGDQPWRAWSVAWERGLDSLPKW